MAVSLPPRLRLALAAVALLVVAGGAVAAGAAALADEEIRSADRQLTSMERAMQAPGGPGADALSGFLSEIRAVRETANKCVGDNESRLATVTENLETLGDVGPGDSAGAHQQRESLERQRDQIEQQLQVCRVLLLRANQLEDRITELQRTRLAERLSEREQPIWAVIAANLREPGQLWTTARLFLLRTSGLGALSWAQLFGLAGLALVCIGGSLYARQPMFALAARVPDEPTLGRGFVQALLACGANVLPALVTSVAVAVYLTLVGAGGDEWAFITLLSYGLAGYFLFLFAVQVFLAPCPPARAYLPASPTVLRSLAGRLRTLALLALVVSVLSATLVVEDFPEPVRDLLRLVVATVLIIELARIIWLSGGLLRWHETRGPRLILTAAMVAALGAEWAGYLQLAEYVVRGVIGTLLSFGAAWFVWRLFDELYEGLDEGRRRWQRGVREFLGCQPGDRLPGLAWLRGLTGLVIWAGFGLLVLLTWGLSDTGLAYLMRLVSEGVAIGEFRIVPVQLFWGLVALVVLLGVTGWFKQRLGQRWLARTRMERGAREAVVTISGYAGVGIAVLVGLAIAGVDFSSIALIAGALSVGIGFGLQNIFNNFVSGLILLFERPIKTDDWIVVGQTEGFVRRISIRSTQIQTFDRADVIVPNSELIQSQVTNWMLRDPFGRVVVPVRVAYGTDPQKVRELLVTIAREHPRVIDDELLAPQPEALFLRFGEFAMELELRAFIRDIAWFLHVASDLNFEIERRFRDHGIEIPYPRQDVRLQRMPGAADSGEETAARPPGRPARGGGGGDLGGGGDGS